MNSSETSPQLSGKTIALGVSGSIAAYKAADLTSELRKSGAEVHVVMTESATKFISALTLGTLSRNPVLSSFWEERRLATRAHRTGRQDRSISWSPLPPLNKWGIMPMDWLPIFWVRSIWRLKRRPCLLPQ